MASLDRAELLINQGKIELAIEQLKGVLLEEPTNAYALTYMALCQLRQGEAEEAIASAKLALASNPEIDFALYVISASHLNLENYKKSENAIAKAISFNPNQPDYYGLKAQLKLISKDYKEAIELAQKGLTIDAEHLFCRNMLSTAQLKSGDKEGSFRTINKALELDPENPLSHANYGWAELEKGSHKKALGHFKEALKYDPHDEYARSGMLETLKAKYVLYRIFLKYYFFMANLKSGTQWAILIGIVVINRLIRGGAESLGEYGFLLNYVSYALILFMVSTWVIEPVFNFFMRLNTYSRYLLTNKESQTATLVGICFSVFVGSFIGWCFTLAPGFVAGMLVGYSLILPVGRINTSRASWVNWLLILYSLSCVLVGGFFIYVTFTSEFGLENNIMLIYVGLIVAFSWLWNFVASANK
ncbi:tetratricopeptide repeat protein [Roseivirga sp.]|uniref:tetratricopeptide repeat protein n=1 Tax=Roseivirga sp. TaxID=1964215 RepID=UPI003B8D4DCD